MMWGLRRCNTRDAGLPNTELYPFTNGGNQPPMIALFHRLTRVVNPTEFCLLLLVAFKLPPVLHHVI
jgi:hypothetical protein